MACLGLEPGAAGWSAQTIPLTDLLEPTYYAKQTVKIKSNRLHIFTALNLKYKEYSHESLNHFLFNFPPNRMVNKPLILQVGDEQCDQAKSNSYLCHSDPNIKNCCNFKIAKCLTQFYLIFIQISLKSLKGGGQIVKIDQFGHTGDDFFLLWALRTRLKQMLNVEFCRIHEYWILAFCFLPLDKITAFQNMNYSQESDILRKLISVEDCLIKIKIPTRLIRA